MIKRLLAIILLGITLSGCFMGPLVLLGPATSGFTSASIIQAGFTSGANYLIKKNTGMSISERVFNSISEDILQQSFLPKIKVTKTKKKILPHAN